MSDIEERLTAALRGAADDAPPAVGLAGAARVRRSRRRRTNALTSTAAVAAVVAVVGGVALLGAGGEGSPDGVVADDPTSPGVVAGPPVRLESWRDLSVTVPESWGYGALSTWCTDGATEPGVPVVERAEGMRDMILCTEPANGYGVQFFDASLADMPKRPGELWRYQPGNGKVYPDGAWLGYQRSGDNVVMVVSRDEAEATTVLGSFTANTSGDANGCRARADEPSLPVDPGDTMRLCRYGGDGWLEQSEVLVGQDAVDAVSALDAAPVSPARPCPDSGATFVVVTGDDVAGQVSIDSCAGMSWGGEHRSLTADVLHWVLSPGWSGQVPDGITFEPRG